LNIERVRLLIRVANQIPNGEDKNTLLAWADEILADTQINAHPTRHGQINLPIPVFRRYKGRRHEGRLLRGGRLQINGHTYSSVSAAAIHISGHQENGWRTWRYIDESTGEEKSIDALRQLI
jgi:hypothetical protein